MIWLSGQLSICNQAVALSLLSLASVFSAPGHMINVIEFICGIYIFIDACPVIRVHGIYMAFDGIFVVCTYFSVV